jgi:hypothetical protein
MAKPVNLSEPAVEPAQPAVEPAVEADQAEAPAPNSGPGIDAGKSGELLAFPRPRWEYTVLQRWHRDTLEAQLNRLGAEGWELITEASNTFIFGRQLDSE